MSLLENMLEHIRMKTANINLPRILKVGGGASRELPKVIGALGLNNPLLVTDPFIAQCG